MEKELKQEIWEQSKEWIDAIGNVVNEMALKMGVASEHVYKVYTKQMFFEGLTEALSSLLFIIVTIIFYMILNKGANKLVEEEEFLLFVKIVSTIILFVIVGYQLDDIREGSLMMFNPEYYTMKDLLESVKGLVSK